MQLEDLKNKRIAVLGFGVEGQAVGKFLQSQNLDFDVLDQNPEVDLSGFAHVGRHLGSDYLAHAPQYDVIFRSPGIRMFSELIVARGKGAVITSQMDFFFEHCPAKIIGVTGTKGKGTTSTLIFEMLKRAGQSVYLGGNIGAEVLSLLDKLTPEDLVVLELSSFQLQDLNRSPHIAVVLMVTSEHLDYHGNTAEYVAAKSAITKFQTVDDFAVVNRDFEGSMQIGEQGKAKKYYVRTTDKPVDFESGIVFEKKSGTINFIKNGTTERFMDASEVFLPGLHNLQNICAASQAAVLAGADLDSVRDVIKEFKGLEHRLEFVTERAGIKFYNDSYGTTPESALAAVRAFAAPEIAVVGGFDKKGEYQELGRELAAEKNIKAVVLIGQVAPQIKHGLVAEKFAGAILESAKDMTEAFEQIRTVAQAGDVVVLAPGTSSFDWFKNYKERGNVFKKLAQEF